MQIYLILSQLKSLKLHRPSNHYYFFVSDTSNGAVAKPSITHKQPTVQQQLQQQQNQQNREAAQQPPPPPPPRKPEQPQNNLFDLIGQPQQQRPMGPLVLPGLNKAKQPEILQRLSVATSANDQFPGKFLKRCFTTKRESSNCVDKSKYSSVQKKFSFYFKNSLRFQTLNFFVEI